MDWLEEQMGGYDDDYLIIDCPGMIIFESRLYLSYPTDMARRTD